MYHTVPGSVQSGVAGPQALSADSAARLARAKKHISAGNPLFTEICGKLFMGKVQARGHYPHRLWIAAIQPIPEDKGELVLVTLRGIVLSGQDVRNRSMVGVVTDRVLWFAMRESAEDATTPLLALLEKSIPHTHVITIAASTPCTLARLHERQNELVAMFSLPVLRNWPSGPISSADLHPHLVLERLRNFAAREPDLLTGRIKELRALDHQAGTELVKTLDMYFRCSLDARATADRLFVHPNTVRYRLHRVRELVGLDLTDPLCRLVAELQLRLSDDVAG